MRTIAYFIFLVLLLPALFCRAQTEQMVVAKSGLIIRDSGSVEATPVCSVKFGEMVQLSDYPRLEGMVNGMHGNWVKIRYAGCTGFVFDAYLANLKKQDKRFPENYPQYFNLGAVCGEDQYFNSDFYWYGVFEDTDGFTFSAVDPEFSVNRENFRDVLYDRYLRIKVMNMKKPMFLVGLPDSLPNYTFERSELTYLQKSCGAYHIYPGEHFDVTSTSPIPDATYWLESYGKVLATKYGDSIQQYIPPFWSTNDYGVRIVQVTNDKIRTKNIVEDIESGLFYEHMLDIKFIGDLNYDSVPDMLCFHSVRHSVADSYLFMSGYSQKEILTKVAVNRWVNCY